MDTQSCAYRQTQCSARKPWLRLLTSWQNLLATFQHRNELARQRRLLRELDDHLLKDIGLSRADVSRIAGRRWSWDDRLNHTEDLDQRYRSSDHDRPS